MRMRTAALIGSWGLAMGVATAVSWAAVSLVGDEVSPSGVKPLSQAEVERRIHAGRASSSVPPGAGTSTGIGSTAPAPGGTTVQRSVVAQGGTVVLACTGQQITARTSPRSGYTVTEDSGSEATEVKIIFVGGSHRSQVEGVCRSGAPVADVHESGVGQEE
jgi:hypothetical protein